MYIFVCRFLFVLSTFLRCMLGCYCCCCAGRFFFVCFRCYWFILKASFCHLFRVYSEASHRHNSQPTVIATVSEYKQTIHKICVMHWCCVIESRHSPCFYIIYINAIRSITVCVLFFFSPALKFYLLARHFFSLCYSPFCVDDSMYNIDNVYTMFTAFFIRLSIVFGVCYR